ncbi:MAG: hypothetical protein GF353_23395 [Candidatus Lokiarchaeota archaeon]|nr:hypothetical protein [Candidatus Lokiarchaeota archaeon]
MADYFCWPLWYYKGTDKIGNIDPKKLNLKEKTIKLLEKWAEKFDSFIDIEEPNRDLEISKEELESFEKQGLMIWKRLKKELKEEYEVAFFSNKFGKIFENIENY